MPQLCRLCDYGPEHTMQSGKSLQIVSDHNPPNSLWTLDTFNLCHQMMSPPITKIWISQSFVKTCHFIRLNGVELCFVFTITSASTNRLGPCVHSIQPEMGSPVVLTQVSVLCRFIGGGVTWHYGNEVIYIVAPFLVTYIPSILKYNEEEEDTNMLGNGKSIMHY